MYHVLITPFNLGSRTSTQEEIDSSMCAYYVLISVDSEYIFCSGETGPRGRHAVWNPRGRGRGSLRKLPCYLPHRVCNHRTNGTGGVCR